MYGIDASGDLEPFGIVGLAFSQVWQKKEYVSGECGESGCGDVCA